MGVYTYIYLYSYHTYIFTPQSRNKAGALFRTLEIFAREGINLTRIESVPDTPGKYAIFIDFEGSLRDAKVAKAMEAQTPEEWKETFLERQKISGSGWAIVEEIDDPRRKI